MIFYVSLIVAFIFFQLFISRYCNRLDRPFVWVFVFSTAYYSLFGPLYWALIKDYDFVGVDWYAGYWDAPLILAFFSLVCLIAVVVLGRMIRFENIAKNAVSFDVFPFKLVTGLGVLGAIYLGVVGIGAGKGLNLQDPFLLIAYQFADLLIPVVLFRIAVEGFTSRNKFILGVLTLLAVLVGYRYRLVFLWAPILALYFSKASSVKRINSIIGSVLILIVFSVLTVARKKFEGVDFDVIDGFDFDDLLYGFFAESNNIFGLLAILKTSVSAGEFIYLDPIFDSVVDFVPRFVFPLKNVGDYVTRFVALGLVSVEGFDSGTAYPYIGEYLMMGGYWACFLGVLAYALLYIYLRHLISVASSNNNVISFGLWLLAMFFGYYNYSRGFIPQVSKTLLFIVIPYIYLMYCTSRRGGVK